MNIKACYSHNTDDWKTPTGLYEYFKKLGFIDPCPYKCKEDNLKNIYKGEKLYINPPFSKLNEWTQFIKENYKRNECIILLMPARTDTKYFHELLELDPGIYFIKGRLAFNDTGCAPFPTILLEFRPYRTNIHRYFMLDKEFYNESKI